jgi:hypothetical protein
MKTIFTICLFAISTSLTAQTVISGTVTDEKGDALPGASIFIQDSYDGASTGSDGSFNFTTTESGEKTIIVSSLGFKVCNKNLVLAGQSIVVNIKLKEEINQLEAVVISAGSFTAGEEKRRTVLKAIDIATTAGATADIAGALNTLPGTQKVGESGRLFVRGGDSNEARTFIDGIVVLDAYGASAPNTPSRGRFLPFMFKGTSFSTGGYSAEYGQALSSALVLNSKDKADLNQTDIGLLSVGADVAHTQVWDRASLTGKIQYTNIRPYFGMINQVVDWKDAPVSIEGSTAFRQQVSKDGMFKFFGNFNQSEFSLYNHDILDPSKKQLYHLINKYRYGNASYANVLNEKWNMRGGFSYTMNQNNATVDGLPLNESEKGMHGKIVFENSLSDRVELKVGSELISRVYEFEVQPSAHAEKIHTDFNESITAVFAETEAYLSNRLVTKWGIRSEYNSLNNQVGVDPRLSIAYKPGEKGQFSFAYGRFRQSAKNIYVRMNHELGSEQAEHFILNYQIINDNRTFRVETYYKNYRRLVKFQNADASDVTNSGNGYAKGVELFWRDSKSFKNVDYWISYSYLDTKRNYLNFPYAATPSFASKHNFSFVYKHFVTKLKSQVGFTYSYSSGRPYYNPNAKKFNNDHAPAYHDLSANISYLPKPYLILYVSCTNLLFRNNVFNYQYSAQPNDQGQYVGRAMMQPAKHFLFVGVFITISKNKSVNQLPSL